MVNRFLVQKGKERFIKGKNNRDFSSVQCKMFLKKSTRSLGITLLALLIGLAAAEAIDSLRE